MCAGRWEATTSVVSTEVQASHLAEMRSRTLSKQDLTSADAEEVQKKAYHPTVSLH